MGHCFLNNKLLFLLFFLLFLSLRGNNVLGEGARDEITTLV